MSAAEKREAPSLPIPSVPSIEEAAAKVQEEDKLQESDDSPMAQEQYTFELDYTSGNGRKYKGTFTNKILTPQDRIRVGQMQAALTGNTPWDALDPETQYFVGMVSQLQISLVKKPDWFIMSGAKAMRDINVLNKVYTEVASHEAFFRKPGETEGPGES
jgi:hypothetical protein